MIRVVRLGTLLGLLLLAAPNAARAEDPPFLGWTALAPGLTTEYQPNSDNDCAAGRPRCVDAVIREMQRRFDPLAASCDHDAIFSLTYLRTTEEYRRASLEPGFFEDPRFVNHEDAVFARYYFEAYDNWHAGRRAAVPAAWAIAFRAADQRAVSAAGNIALGINGHVQRDLPFVLAAIGLVKPDGSSRKPDHDQVNRFLNRVADTLYPEIARRFDPTVDDSNANGTTLDDFAEFQIIPTWREIAWRNSERLVSAPTAAARAQVAADIEAYAASQAQLLRTTYQYGLLDSSAARDAYCAVHHDDL
jgi:Family of unknown function (DUF5995)